MKEGKKENHCTACDSEIPAAAPGGLCPKCLLKSAVAESSPAPSDADLPTMAMDADLPTDFSTAAASAASFSNSKSSPPEKKGAADFAPSDEELESLFPDLEILELLGAGGMGAVYKARQKRLDRLVALKVLSCPPESHESFSLRFEREAQLLAKLHHPYIVTIFDFGEIEEDGPNGLPLFYFLMEYVDGSDLSKRIRSGSLSVDETLAIIPQICEALQMAHDAGITHRDVKPANILLDSEGQARVADFGVAKIVENDDDLMTGLTLTGTTMGTPYYMAPEQWDSPEKVDHRSDIYSLGVIFYQMLTGERPVGRFLPPSKKAAVDPRIDDIVFKALETKRKDRYPHAREMAQEVREVVATDTSTSRNSAGKKIALGLIASAVIGFGVWWGTQPKHEDIQAETPLKSEQEKLDEIPSFKKPLAAQSASSVYPPGEWVPILKTQAELDTALFSNQGKNTIRDGWIDGSITEKTATLRFPATEAKNCGLRLRLRLKISDREPLPTVLTISLRTSKENPAIAGLSAYRLSIFGMHREKLSVSSGYYQLDSNKWTPLSTSESTPLPVPGDEFDVEFYTIGSQLIGRFDGHSLDMATDTRLESGQVMMQNPHLIRDVEFINLDGLSEAEALKIAGISDTDPTTQKFAPGHLRAVGTRPGGTPPDLSKVATFNDIIDVGGQVGDWVALRSNGETISATGKADFENIHKISWSFADNFALIDTKGRLCYPEKIASNLPPEFEQAKLIDVKLGPEHGIALTRDGRAMVFGKRYKERVEHKNWGTERWPLPPENCLSDIKAIAATHTFAATLKNDGTLTVFGYQGVLKLPKDKGLKKVEAIGSSENRILALDSAGQVWCYAFHRDPLIKNSLPGAAIELNSFNLRDRAVRLKGESWLDESGRWNTAEGSMKPLLKNIETTDCYDLTVSAGRLNMVPYQSLLWIEPSASAAPSKPLTSSKANLPPALAAMKERGGQLRQWHSESVSPIDISAAAGARNLIALNGSLTPTEPRWLVRTSTGESITSLTDFDRSSELIALGSHNGLLRDGTLLHCWKTQRELNANNIADADFCKNSNNLQFELLQHDNGTVSMRPHEENSAWNGEEFAEIREKIAQIKDAAAIDCGWGAAAVLRANGEVFSWGSLDGIVKSAPQISTAVEIAVGPETWAARLADGTVKVWLNFKEHNNGSSLYMSPPDDLAPAFAIRVSQKVCAAQMADGTWRAWGRDDSGLIEKINSLGPAVDILFVTTSQLTEGGGLKQQDSKLLWIEPAKPEDTIPLSPPGKLTATGTYSNGEPIDISRAKGINDFVKVVLQRSGWIGLREDGTTVSSDATADRKNIINLYPVGHDDFALVDKDHSFAFSPDNKKSNLTLNEEFPADLSKTKMIDYFGMVRHSLALLEDGSVRVWGDRYDHPEKLPEWVISKNAWPRPPADATRNVISIGGGISFAGTMTADGKLWLWDHDGIIDLGEWERLQGKFVSLGKSAHHRTDAMIADGRFLQINKLADIISLSAKPEEIVSTSDTGYRSLYQNSKGNWHPSWPTDGIAPFLESIKDRPPEAFSMITDSVDHETEKGKASIGLITINPDPAP